MLFQGLMLTQEEGERDVTGRSLKVGDQMGESLLLLVVQCATIDDWNFQSISQINSIKQKDIEQWIKSTSVYIFPIFIQPAELQFLITEHKPPFKNFKNSKSLSTRDGEVEA